MTNHPAAAKLLTMSAVLALAGCGPRLEIAVSAEGMAAPGLIALSGPTPRSDLIMAAVDLVLAAAGVTPTELSDVLVTRGPGSFTGVRVALATAQGLVTSLGLSGAAAPSLVVQAARTAASPCLAVQPARRTVVYAQRFVREGGAPAAGGEPFTLALDDLAASEIPVIAPAGLALPTGTPAAPALRSTAEALLELHRMGRMRSDSDLVPLYLEPPAAVPPRRTVKPWQPSPRDS